MSFGKKIVSGLLWGQVGMTGRTVMCFFISILVVRTLGARNYGIYVALLCLIEILIKFTEIGIQSIFSTYIPRFINNNQLGECSYVVRRVIILRVIVSTLTAGLLQLLAGPLVAYIGNPEIYQYVLLTSVWFFFRSLMDCFIFIVTSKMDMKFYSAVEMGVSVFQLIGVLILLRTGLTISSLIILMIAVNAVQTVFYAIGSLDMITPKSVRLEIGPIAKFGVITWLSSIVQYFRFKSIDVFLILYFLRDPSNVAYYDIAYLLVITGGSVLLTSADRLLLPIFSETHSRLGLDGLRKIWDSMTKLTIYLAVPIYAFLIVHADTIISLFYTDAYLTASPLVVVFSSFMIACVFFAGETSITVVFPLNKEQFFLYLRGIGGVLNFVFNIIFIPKFGIMGAVLGTSGAMLITTILELAVANKLISARLPYRFIATLSLIIIVSLSWTIFIKDMNIIQLGVVAVSYGVVTTLLLLKFYAFDDDEKKIVQEFNPSVYDKLIKYRLLR